MQIIVLGMHRSGTSMVTKLLAMMGVALGEDGRFGSNVDNPTGFWERRDVVLCNALLLKMHDPAWNALNFSDWVAEWVAKEPEHPHEELIEQVRTILFAMDNSPNWAIKDPQMCLALPHWKSCLRSPLCIVLSRNPFESVASLMRRQFNTFTDAELAIAMWEYHAVGIIKHAADMPKIFVRHDELIAQPVLATANLYDDLCARDVQGITLPAAKEITDFIEPTLYRAKDVSGRTLTPHQQRLYAMLRGEEKFDSSVEVSPESLRIMLSK